MSLGFLDSDNDDDDLLGGDDLDDDEVEPLDLFVGESDDDDDNTGSPFSPKSATTAIGGSKSSAVGITDSAGGNFLDNIFDKMDAKVNDMDKQKKYIEEQAKKMDLLSGSPKPVNQQQPSGSPAFTSPTTALPLNNNNSKPANLSFASAASPASTKTPAPMLNGNFADQLRQGQEELERMAQYIAQKAAETEFERNFTPIDRLHFSFFEWMSFSKNVLLLVANTVEHC